jgi:hypothetical protein
MTPDERWTDYRDKVLRVAFPNRDLEAFRLTFFAGLLSYDFELQEAAAVADFDEGAGQARLNAFHERLKIIAKKENVYRVH